MAKTIAIVSGKGGVGKTSTTANLALALQEFSQSVVALDCDMSAADLAIQLDLHTDPDRTLQAALENDDQTLSSISLHESGLMAIPSTHAMKEENIAKPQLAALLDKIDGTVLIDAPPGLSDNVHTVLDLADYILIVTNPDIPAVSDAVKVSEAIEAKQGHRDNTYAIITKSNEIGVEVGDTEIETALEIPVIAKIPYDRSLKESIHEQTPVVQHAPHASSAIAYWQLAAQMTDNDYTPPRLAPIKRALNKVRGQLK